jgi:hypothetical protein
VESEIGPMPHWQGSYRIQRAGAVIGREVFQVRTASSGATLELEGSIELSWPSAQMHRYRLSLDPQTLEPVAVVWVLDLPGLGTVESKGVLHDDQFEFSCGFGVRRNRAVPYGTATLIDFVSPMADAVGLFHRMAALKTNGVFDVRTVSVLPPALCPEVGLKRFVYRGEDGALSKVAIENGVQGPPSAYWVREDGLPTRVRTWSSSPENGQPPIEYVLQH